MKNQVLKVVVALVAAAMVSSSLAQSAGPRPGQGGAGAQNREAMMKKVEEIKKKVATELKLTPDQVNKIKALDKKQADKMRALREKNQGKTGNREAMMAEFQKMRASYDKELQAILGSKTAKYQARMREETAKLRGPGAGGAGNRTGAGRTGGGTKTGGGSKTGGKSGGR